MQSWLACGLATLTLVGTVWAQTPDQSTFFLFPLQWDDTDRGVATDVSFLNTAPAGSHGRIRTRDGHFVEEQTGERVRFFGTNIGAAEAFPEKADAELIAQRLAKAGVNVVRLHHLDNPWAITSGGSLWDPARKDRQVLNAETLDKLDYLVAQLKNNGIYVNLNLKVSKELSAADDMPPSIADVPFTHQKRIDYFQSRMVELQKDYARRLLTHVNPYTGLAYTDDPAVAFVEINNENSLLGFWTRDLGRGLDQLPEPFQTQLANRWTQWLKARYGTDDALREAWSRGMTQPGASIIKAGDTWTLEQHGSAKASLTQSLRSMQQQGASDAASLQVNVTQVDGTSWHVQSNRTGLTLAPDETYTFSFRIKSDAPRPVTVQSTLDVADWHNVGLSANLQATPQWTAHSLVFTARDPMPQHVRVGFTLGQETGAVSIENIELTPGAKGAGLKEGESVNGRIAIPTASTRAQWDDWIAFLVDVERNYADEMLDFLRDELKVQANIALTQIDYGGIAGIHREQRMDWADAHAYWQHPSFPGASWDPANWRIENTPQLAELSDEGFGALGNMAINRVAGKPFTVSEYDHPAPSDYAVEMLPTYATFAAVQNWDGIYTFAVADYSSETKPDRILGFFDQVNHPAKWCFYPTAALIFRQGLVEPAPASATLQLAEPIWSKYQFADQAWRDLLPGAIDLLNRRVAIGNEPLPADAEPKADTVSGSPSQARLQKTPKGQAYIVAAPAAAVFVGYIGGANLAAGDVTLRTNPFGNNFAAVTAVAIDSKPLEQSDRVLVTVCGRVENTNMAWNENRTTVSTNWGTGPTLAEHVPATLVLPVDGERTVYILDSAGRRTGEAATRVSEGHLTLTVRPEDKTLLYEIVKP